MSLLVSSSCAFTFVSVNLILSPALGSSVYGWPRAVPPVSASTSTCLQIVMTKVPLTWRDSRLRIFPGAHDSIRMRITVDVNQLPNHDVKSTSNEANFPVRHEHKIPVYGNIFYAERPVNFAIFAADYIRPIIGY